MKPLVLDGRPRTITRILVANRGEIALRIVRTCREIGIATIAVYSDADRESLHVAYADEAYRIGPPPAAESYLLGEAIIEVAVRCGASAVHPGYGFLSENASFARACTEAGLIFIGPAASAMVQLGSKTNARQAADRANVPRVPGSRGAVRDIAEATLAAEAIGFPVMLKASAGGGGKGMRSVASNGQLASAFLAASSEAERSFGNGELYLEKLIEYARHIEIQLMADQHGNCLYLGERECSVQRRHQKVIEEAPSAAISDGLRMRMGEAAVRLALSAGYTNAGTVEFLVDSEENFYFLEVNTRLQVEHPVTELVTGLDLVRMQIEVAMGLPLALTQDQVSLRGHAIECRIYAEDPENNFMPSPGRITRLLEPSGPGIRVDSGIYAGWHVPLDYDPMLAKLVAYGADREVAIARMLRALEEYAIGGIKTNIALFGSILRDPDFRHARIDTGYLERLLAQGAGSREPVNPPEELIAIAAALFSCKPDGGRHATQAPNTSERNWRESGRREALRP